MKDELRGPKATLTERRKEFELELCNQPGIGVRRFRGFMPVKGDSSEMVDQDVWTADFWSIYHQVLEITDQIR